MTIRDKGFTLIELVVVMIIAAIIAALAIPAYLNIRRDATTAQEEAVVGSLKEAISHYQLTHAGAPYQGNPFDLLVVTPINENIAVPPSSGDGKKWLFWGSGVSVIGINPDGTITRLWGGRIFCPHYVSGSRGCAWAYSTKTSGNISEATLTKIEDYGH